MLGGSALVKRYEVHWEDVSDKMQFPDEGTKKRMRHGTVIAVPEDVAAGLER